MNGIQSCQNYLSRVHLVDSDDELTNTKSKGKKSVFTSLAILGDTSFEFTSTASNNKDSTISLRGSRDHVLNEVTVTRGVNDLDNSYFSNGF
jgi:hypothetical protein